jgi:glutathione S-transferase
VEVDLSKGEQKKPEFLKLNPKHTVPTLLTDYGFSLWESNAIMRFLCYENELEKYYPSQPRVRARIDLALDWRHDLYKVCF